MCSIAFFQCSNAALLFNYSRRNSYLFAAILTSSCYLKNTEKEVRMMIDQEKISAEFAEAVEAMDVSVDTDIGSQQRTRREAELNRWSDAQARKTAEAEGIVLTTAHLAVVQSLREHYREHGIAKNGRDLGDMLDNKFASQGGRKYLRRLFPGGPVAQGMRIAGLPVPAYSEDEGFGTAR
jgi:TusE/DsrC/DsvC family sulfur relay protein